MPGAQFYNTKILVEVDVSTQFGPNDAVNLVRTNLKCPAVSNIKIKEVRTDFVVHKAPSGVMMEVPELIDKTD